MKFVGIDPGQSGAVAVVDETGMIAESYDMPVIDVGKKEVSETGLAQLLRDICMGSECRVYVEKVGAMPKQGVASTFKFGKSYGLILGCLAMLGVSYELVGPKIWQKLTMAGQPKDKDASRVVASRLFPDVPLHLKKHHGRADALLIAEYGRRLNTITRIAG